MSKKRLVSAILAAAMIIAATSTSLSASAAAVDEETSGVTGTIRFDPGDWNSKKINFYIWDGTTNSHASKDGWVDADTWGSKKIKGNKLDDGTFESYEFEITEGQDLYVIFHDPDKGQTFDCVLDASAMGDIARRTGEMMENPVDSEKLAEAVKFEKSGLTSKLCITSSGKVQGEIITPNMVPAHEVAVFMSKYIGTKEKLSGEDVVTADTVKAALDAFGVTKDEVWEDFQTIEGASEKADEVKAVLDAIQEAQPEPKPVPEPEPKPEPKTPVGKVVDGITLGDVDADGAITSADALSVLRASVDLEKLEGDTAKAADVDQDTFIDSYDSLMILRASVGLDGYIEDYDLGD